MGHDGSFLDVDTLYPASGAITTLLLSGFIPSNCVPLSLTFYTLFQTPALSIAVIAQTEQMEAILKYLTEEALTEMGRVADGDWFFFRSMNTTSASPEEIFLTPQWEQAFGINKAPLLVIDE